MLPGLIPTATKAFFGAYFVGKIFSVRSLTKTLSTCVVFSVGCTLGFNYGFDHSQKGFENPIVIRVEPTKEVLRNIAQVDIPWAASSILQSTLFFLISDESDDSDEEIKDVEWVEYGLKVIDYCHKSDEKIKTAKKERGEISKNLDK